MTNIELASYLIRVLGRYLPHDILLGGSLGLEIAFPQFKQFKTSDIDIFILGNYMPPKVREEVLSNITNTFLDKEHLSILDADYVDSKLPKQFGRTVYTINGTKVDFIFLNTSREILVSKTSSSIGRMYMARSADSGIYSLIEEARDDYDLIREGKCHYVPKDCTFSHLTKLKVRCKHYGLEMITNIYTDEAVI